MPPAPAPNTNTDSDGDVEEEEECVLGLVDCENWDKFYEWFLVDGWILGICGIVVLLCILACICCCIEKCVQKSKDEREKQSGRDSWMLFNSNI